MHPGDQRDHGDHRLSERRREQRACQSMWPEARDDGTDDSDGEHPDIHKSARSPARPRTPTAPMIQTRRNGVASARPTADLYAVLSVFIALILLFTLCHQDSGITSVVLHSAPRQTCNSRYEPRRPRRSAEKPCDDRQSSHPVDPALKTLRVRMRDSSVARPGRPRDGPSHD